MSKPRIDRESLANDSTAVTVVDLGVGNIGSIVNMLRLLRARPSVASSVEGLTEATKVILPGVGHGDHAAARIEQAGWRKALVDLAMVERRAVLGVCLGMQLLLEKSEEGDLPGLGLIPGRVAHFDFAGVTGEAPRIPHMGWNVVTDVRPHELSPNGDTERRFYFAHSYHAADIASEHTIMQAQYGYDFVCGVRRENVWGVQFHPEKSHRFGMRLLSQFLGV